MLALACSVRVRVSVLPVALVAAAADGRVRIRHIRLRQHARPDLAPLLRSAAPTDQLILHPDMLLLEKM